MDYTYVNQAKKRDKLISDLSNKFRSADDVAEYLTDSIYSHLTGIRIPLPEQERATKRFNTMKRNDIKKISEKLQVSSVSFSGGQNDQSGFESLYFL